MTQPALKGVTSPHRDYVTVDGAWMQFEMFEFKFEWSMRAEPMYQELAWLGLKYYKQAWSVTGLNLVGLAGLYLLHVYYESSFLAV